MKTERPNLKIGDTVYGYWRLEPFTIRGETARSWLLEWPGKCSFEKPLKIPKAAMPKDYTADRGEWVDVRFASEYRYRIAQAVASHMLCSPQQLRAVADLIGWKPPETKEANRG